MIINKNSHINRTIKIKEFHCKINLEIKYYSNQKGILKGIKNLTHKNYIYLIELINHNRVWATRKEFEFSKHID